MEPEITGKEVLETKQKGVLFQVTPLSKYLAMILFILMPFIGGWIGYTYAPEKVVEVEKIVAEDTDSNDGNVVEKTDIWNDDNYFKAEVGLVPIFLNDYFSTSSKYSFGISGERYFWGWSDDTYTSKVLRVITPVALDEGLTLRTFDGVDIDTFEDLGNDYARDTKNVYYFGANPRMTMGPINGADPKTFEVLDPITDLFGDGFARDKDSFFYLSKNLIGVNPDNYKVDELGIIYGDEVVWFPANDCHFGNFRQGNLEEVNTFEQPC